MTSRLYHPAFALVVITTIALAAQAQSSCSSSVTGAAVPAMAALDQAMQNSLSTYSVAGGALAVSYNGRLVFARGYGCADTQSNTPVQPDSLFRFASVSKTFTAIGIMQLVQQNKLSLNASVFASILTGYQPLPGNTINPDLLKITVQNLLEHTGGWDRSTTQHFNGTPYNEPLDGLLAAAAKALGHAQPATDSDVIRVMLSQPLQHTPGVYYAYSNFGYALLGRVIEHVSGVGYEQYVQQNILKPLGIGRQKLGATLQSDVVNGEVTYYDYPGAPLVPSVFPDVTARVPAPYGGHFLEDVDSAGAWVSTAVDLTRFLNGIDGVGGGAALLNASTLAQMQVDPKVQNEVAGSFYGLGFVYQQLSTGLRWTKDGGLAGTSSYVVHSPTGYTWAVVFNGNPSQSTSTTSNEDSSGTFISNIVGPVETILGQVGNNNAIPKNNLYSNFQSTLLTPTFSTTDIPVENGATYQAGIVSGSWVAIKGQNLATATRTWWADEIVGPVLPVEIDHVRVTINGKNAAVEYVSPTQLNVLAPSDTLTGPVNVQVIRDGAASAVIQANYVSTAPGFFAYLANSKNFAAGAHLNGAYLGDIPGTLPAAPGETIVLFATGLGQSAGNVVGNVVVPPPTLTIGGVPAPVSFAGLVYPGEWQLNVLVPQVSAGEQPITISYGGATPTVSTYLAIASN
jgi:uncharacterized protein (TIGR03437 family)